MRETILSTVKDLASVFIYYDRKEDEELPKGAIEQAIADGEITIEEIVNEFREGLIEYL